MSQQLLECLKHRQAAICRRAATRDELLRVLEATDWNRGDAARILGVDRTTVWRRMRRFGLAKPGNPPSA